jgi:uncharacterized protein (DUF983 family)
MASFGQHIVAIWRKQCPRCLQGPIYERGMKMNKNCPVCGLLLEREEGYFMGALYISYTLASIFMGLLFLTIYLLEPEWDLGVSLLLAVAIFLPFAPAVTRYARIIWIHFDRWAWPESGK